MPRRSSCVGTFVTSRSSMVIVPPVGSIMRLIMRSVVVLPLPDDPTSTVIWPVAISIDRSSTALVPSGYCFVTWSKRIMTRPQPLRSSGYGTWDQVENGYVVGVVERHEAVDTEPVVRHAGQRRPQHVDSRARRDVRDEREAR